jgi:hypothetical protein
METKVMNSLISSFKRTVRSDWFVKYRSFTVNSYIRSCFKLGDVLTFLLSWKMITQLVYQFCWASDSSCCICFWHVQLILWIKSNAKVCSSNMSFHPIHYLLNQSRLISTDICNFVNLFTERTTVLAHCDAVFGNMVESNITRYQPLQTPMMKYIQQHIVHNFPHMMLIVLM